MMEVLVEFLVFAGKALVVVVGFIAVLITGFGLAMRGSGEDSDLKLLHWNKKLKNQSSKLREKIGSKKEVKAWNKSEKKKDKEKSKKSEARPKLFVIDFNGDIKASQTDSLRDEVTLVVEMADPKKDQVLVKVESPGGVVHGYGLAAAQLLRFKSAGLPLTVAVDKVAASGGYMMACTANRIISAPFAILGSIGVLAQIPNFHRLLKKNDVDYQEITAGEYKRTLSLFGEVTDKGKEKFTEQIQDTHDLFKKFVTDSRPQLDIAKVATGEYWYGMRALDLGLTDELMTSDEYLLSKKNDFEIYQITIEPKKKLKDKLSEAMHQALVQKIPQWLKQTDLENRYL